MSISRYQAGASSAIANSEADQGIDNYDYARILQILRTRAGQPATNAELNAKADKTYVDSQDNLRVPVEPGKGLSANDFTNTYKTLVDQLGVSFNTTLLVTQEPTGFTSNSAIDISYNATTRKVTLTGAFEAYYLGIRVAELVSGWESSAHDVAFDTYFLYYHDGVFYFNTTPWVFSDLMICYAQYNTADKFALRETHGFMPNSVHQEFHQTIGAYKVSGGDITSYVLNSTTALERRLDMSSTNIADEDLTTTIDALNTKAYTQRYLSGLAVRTFTTGAADIIALSGNQPYYNLNTGGTWSQALFPNNNYGAIFIMAIPTTSDVGSLNYRYLFVQPQQVSATLSVIQGLSPSSLALGDVTLLVTEFVFIGRIIVRYSGGNWTIVQVDKLDGTRVSQVAYSAGNFLSSVDHDVTLTGSGTPASPLGVIAPAGIVASTPATSGATGTPGAMRWDANFLYLCIATNTWRRIAHVTW
jgi:hypothetical protein